ARARDPMKTKLPDVLQIFTGFKSNCTAWRNANLFAGPGVSADSPLAWLHLEDSKAAQLDSLAALHRGAHRVEYCVDRHLSFDFGDVGDFRHFVDDVDLDHA